MNKKILWLILVLICTCLFHTCNCQTVSVDVQVERVVLKEKHFNDLTFDEQNVLLDKIKQAYYLFRKHEINPDVLFVYMKENNPLCEWTGKHTERSDKIVKYYTVNRKYILEIFEL